MAAAKTIAWERVVACPQCHAAPLHPCKRPSEGAVFGGAVHVERQNAASAQWDLEAPLHRELYGTICGQCGALGGPCHGPGGQPSTYWHAKRIKAALTPEEQERWGYGLHVPEAFGMTMPSEWKKRQYRASHPEQAELFA
jgi:hypothetical protein